MHADFSRWTFDPQRHFLRVLMQQGRVLLDSDWNEQSAILIHLAQALSRDLYGPYGGPVDGAGFEIGLEGHRLTISPGHYYVNGVLCELNRDTPLRWERQPFLTLPTMPDPDQPMLLYMDVWERDVTYIQDATLREIALGANAPDTTPARR